PGGVIDDITPAGFNARTRVQEYGGGAYLVKQGTVWFSNFADQRLYRQDPGLPPIPITPEKDIRHADFVLDERRQRLIAVREDHSTGAASVVNSIVSLATTPHPDRPPQGGRGNEVTLVEGNDFYAAPRLSPSGTQLCWLTWNHPRMPWDGTELWIAELADDGGLKDARKLAGGDQESIFQPAWSPNGILYFVSARNNRWNPFRWRAGRVEAVIELAVDPNYISVPEAIEFPTEGGVTAHGFFYPPKNPGYAPPASELPPLIVYVHGGPTSAVSNALDLADQFWTTRGFAYLVVNYGGSTGFGREYRQRLSRKWGVVDVNDSINGARYVIDRGRVDGNRVAVTGGSAGGYTVLRAMTSTDFFKAGASHYGISDLEVFHTDTHKFESMYDQSLIGRWAEDRQVYRERSAIHFVDRISAPIILFQGLEDKIVPPNQAELIVEAMRVKGLPVAYIAFAGEQHGFRMAKNIKRALEAELYFYSRVFGFELPDPIEPVPIENMKQPARSS